MIFVLLHPSIQIDAHEAVILADDIEKNYTMPYQVNTKFVEWYLMNFVPKNCEQEKRCEQEHHRGTKSMHFLVTILIVFLRTASRKWRIMLK